MVADDRSSGNPESPLVRAGQAISIVRALWLEGSEVFLAGSLQRLYQKTLFDVQRAFVSGNGHGRRIWACMQRLCTCHTQHVTYLRSKHVSNPGNPSSLDPPTNGIAIHASTHVGGPNPPPKASHKVQLRRRRRTSACGGVGGGEEKFCVRNAIPASTGMLDMLFSC